MLEKTITNKILKFLKTQPNCFAWKTHGDSFSQAGIPDIICCFDGKFLAFEVKAPNGKLSKLQEIIIEKIRNANGLAFKVTSLEEVEKIFREVSTI
ncbi:MAG: VRR-NUC domain-containing protein [Oscillospiraceae bacterium]|nr:VRR-NUC domain-containing protein [Oscillospiraceae bacterium]